MKISIDRFIKIPEQFKYAAQLNHIDDVLTYEEKLNIISEPISEEDEVIYIDAIETKKYKRLANFQQEAFLKLHLFFLFNTYMQIMPKNFTDCKVG